MPFEPLGNRSQDDAGKRDDDESDKQRVRLERLTAIGDHESHPLARAQHFSDNDSNQSDRHTLTHTRQDERYRTGNRKRFENLPVRGTECARRPKQITIHVTNTGDSVYENRKESRKKNDEY